MNKPAVILLAGAALLSLAGGTIAPAGAAPIRGMPADSVAFGVGNNVVQAQFDEGNRRRYQHNRQRRWRDDADDDWGHRHHRRHRHHHYPQYYVAPPPFFYGFPFYFAPSHHHRW